MPYTSFIRKKKRKKSGSGFTTESRESARLMTALMFHAAFMGTDTYSLEDSLIEFSSYFTNKPFKILFFLYTLQCCFSVFSKALQCIGTVKQNTSEIVFVQLC